MLIKDLFQRDIFRSIDIVLNAECRDDATVWQELDEFVVTNEITRFLQLFLSSYLESIGRNDAEINPGKIGVWISGEFNAGKTHLLKVLSYLLSNEPHSHNGQTMRAVEFFGSKVDDTILLGQIRRAAEVNTDVILFNIGSKADFRASRKALLAVFLKVLNEMQGYDGDHPNIAHMERYLDGKGKLDAFKAAYQELTCKDWIKERDFYEFNRVQVLEALSKTLGQSQESCAKWIDNADDNFSMSVETFCTWLKEYLDSKGSDHRIVFLVDEIGGFIGTDVYPMLNLQTIIQDLGTVFKGRAWVVVTSQEEITQVIRKVKTAASNDFSIIQARFQTSLLLSQRNIAEFVPQRLLAKRPEVIPLLESLYAANCANLNRPITISNGARPFAPCKDADDFYLFYPFFSYHLHLIDLIVQEIIRTSSCRAYNPAHISLLDIFHSAAKKYADSDIGTCVPLHAFYPFLECLLAPSLRRLVLEAETRNLTQSDIALLRTLATAQFLQEPSIDIETLATLSLERVDTERSVLRAEIEASLQRLQQHKLVLQDGDRYSFASNLWKGCNQ